MAEAIPANAAVDVVIAKSARLLDDLPLPMVALLVIHDNWNDYGRNFFAKLHVRVEGRDPLELHMRTMFLDAPRSATAFGELFDKFGDVFPIERVDRQFASLLMEVDHYRQVIEMLGFDVGVSALRKIHDATVARIEGGPPDVLELSAGEEFHFGALRNGGAYDALRRGGRFFRRELPEPVDDLAADFVFSAKLLSARNPYTMAFRFAERGIFRDRASVLIGRNGVGKTQLLKAIVDGLHEDHPEGTVKPVIRPDLRPTRVLVFSSVPTDPFPRSIGSWHGIDYEYFAVNASREAGADPLLTALVACKKTEDSVAFGPNRDRSRMHVVQEALEPIGLWSRLHLPLRRRRPGDDLPHVIVAADDQCYFPIDGRLNEKNLIRLVQQIDWERPAIVLDEAMRPRRLSSGEYAMLRFAAQASAAIEQGSLLLLDEPETHLHPNFISDLMEILDNLLQSTGSIAVIATHSAYVVREAPRDRVNILTIEEGEIRVDSPRMQTFGATIDSISQFVFGDTSVSHRFQRTLDRWADEVGSDLGIDGVLDRYGEELNTESLSYIARRLVNRSRSDSSAEAKS